MTQEVAVDFRKLLLSIKRHIWVIAIITFGLGAGCFLYSKFLIKPVYQSQAILIVNASSQTSQTITNNDVTLSQKLVDTYSIILKSNTLLNQVIKNLDLPMTAKKIAPKISVKGVGTTEVISLTVNDSDPERAADIAGEIIELAPDEIIRTVKAGSVEVISPAEPDSVPIAPNTMMISIIGLVVGFLFSSIVTLCVELFDDKIKSEEDVQSKLGYAVIGIIPNVNRSEGNRGYFHG